MTEAVTLQTYTLELIGPESGPLHPDMWQPVKGPRWGYGIRSDVLEETEENLTDLLPEGYSVRIREWDAEEEHPR